MGVIAFPRSTVGDEPFTFGRRLPSLAVAVQLLNHDRVYPRLDRLQCAVLQQAYRLVQQGDDAPAARVVDYMRFLGAILNDHYCRDSIAFAVAPSMGELSRLATPPLFGELAD